MQLDIDPGWLKFRGGIDRAGGFALPGLARVGDDEKVGRAGVW